MKIIFNGKCPKVVPLPIPFISKSEKEGEIIFDPIADVPEPYATKLLELSGAFGPFQLAEAAREEKPRAVPEESEGEGKTQLSAKYQKHRRKRRYVRRAVPASQKAQTEPSPAMEGSGE